MTYLELIYKTMSTWALAMDTAPSELILPEHAWKQVVLELGAKFGADADEVSTARHITLHTPNGTIRISRESKDA